MTEDDEDLFVRYERLWRKQMSLRSITSKKLFVHLNFFVKEKKNVFHPAENTLFKYPETPKGPISQIR